jgi:catechol 2,3-dioxygenase-like lactoylglutathione lyase family enzyme
LERAKKFYGEVLGLEEMERPDFPFDGVWYRAGECEVHLIVPMEGLDLGKAPTEINPFAVHTAFAIDDYDKTVAVLEAAGLEMLALGAEVGQLWVQDPDGNVIELIAPPAKTEGGAS